MVPTLADAASLPLRWRVALAALGMPVVDRAAKAILDSGANVVGAANAGLSLEVAIARDGHGFSVRIPGRIPPADRMLVA